jgi:hypothetical protein
MSSVLLAMERFVPEAGEAALTNPVLSSLSRPQLEELVVDLSKRWLAHDGLWFQAVEADRGMPTAIRYDTTAWATFTVLEAKRILEFLGLPPGGGLEALEQALPLRLYGFVNTQEVIRVDAHTLVLRMNNCRVQSARSRRGLAAFPCKSVGEVEYAEFARAIDPRIRTRCLVCPPDPHPTDFYCAWEFFLPAGATAGS